jgi:hypothetical protein
MDSIVSGAISGLVTAAVWALLALAYNLSRNVMLHRRLTRSFSLQGRGRTHYGFTIPVHNRTWIPVVVRQVKLYEKYPTASVQLLYHEPADDVIDEPIGKIGEKYVTKTWKSLKPAENTSATERGFVELPAKTGASWILLDKIIPELDCEFETCRIVVEYKTVFGNQKVVAVFAAKEGVRYLNRDYKLHRDQLLKKTSASSQPRT